MNIPDYITLYQSDAITVNNTYKWNIPMSYYSNTRGSVCYVSLVDSCISTTATENIIVKLKNQGQNTSNSKNDGSVLGILKYFTQSTHFENYQPIKVLLNARPPSIEIDLKLLSTNLHANATNFMIVLKFEYYDPQDTQKQYVNTMYQKL